MLEKDMSKEKVYKNGYLERERVIYLSFYLIQLLIIIFNLQTLFLLSDMKT